MLEMKQNWIQGLAHIVINHFFNFHKDCPYKSLRQFDVDNVFSILLFYYYLFLSFWWLFLVFLRISLWLAKDLIILFNENIE